MRNSSPLIRKRRMLREVLGDAFCGAREGNRFNDLEWEEKVGRSSRTLCS